MCLASKTLCLEIETLMQTVYKILVVDGGFVRKMENPCRFGCGIKLNMHAYKPFVYRCFRDAVQV
jgi:hypothetical protein